MALERVFGSVWIAYTIDQLRVVHGKASPVRLFAWLGLTWLPLIQGAWFAGWGTFFASHVYRRTGAFDVVVTLSDDDGGTAVRRVDHLEVTEPTAVWANSTAGRSLDWAGGSGEISGRVHTNGELRFVGASKTVKGGTTYAGSLAADTTRNSFLPLPVRSCDESSSSGPGPM